MYFEDWGTKKNPVRQSDLVTLFGSMFSCPKKFAMSKLYPRPKKIGYKGFFGELMHTAIGQHLMHHGRNRSIEQLLESHPSRGYVYYEKRDMLDVIREYQYMLDAILSSSEFRSMKKRVVEVERAFLVRLGKHWVAGTVDVIIAGKNEGDLVVLDWKTGRLASQYEMDNGYQSNIYCHAVENGEFFLKPDDMESGKSYYNSYQATRQKNRFGSYPKFFFAQLQELVPAKRRSRKKAQHVSSQKLANDDGYIEIEKGQRRGPVFYEAKTSKTNIKRLEHSVSVAVLYAKAGLFPESFGAKCQSCSYSDKCRNLGRDFGQKQEVLGMMQELGIEPD